VKRRLLSLQRERTIISKNRRKVKLEIEKLTNTEKNYDEDGNLHF